MTKANCKERVAAHAHDHGHGHDEEADREAERNACDAEGTHALPDKIAVHNVVEGVHAHADDGGNGEQQNKLRNACCSKGIEF